MFGAFLGGCANLSLLMSPNSDYGFDDYCYVHCEGMLSLAPYVRPVSRHDEGAADYFRHPFGRVRRGNAERVFPDLTFI